ncbi:hypothetical protein B566_EDAN001723 [Ephemera danica]|nr:hypothetical protein B566_EDAN001723 [Ephemera danica]
MLGRLLPRKHDSESKKLLYLKSPSARRVFQEQIDVGEILPNCGLAQQCDDESFAIHVFTGSGKEDGPQLCILGAGLNNGGRGINAALIEPISLRVVSVKNFDTYAGDSTQLETWIQSEILVGDIVIFFTFDEASKELSSFAKKLIFELGSYRVQELHFRSQWFMVSQRGIIGFTPYEILHAATHSRWADAINILQGQAVSPDPVSTENIPREHFCQQHNDAIYEEFCEASARREPLTTALLTNRSLIGNLVFSTPILLLVGSEPLATFEGIAGQPGVSPSLVHVLYEVQQTHTPALAALFGFQAVPLPKPFSRSDDLVLSPDFLAYMAQVMLVLEKDRSLLGAAAWNPNGFQSVTSDVHAAYRVEEFPGVGFLLPMAVARDGWPEVLRASNGGNLIVPDVSRVLLPSSYRLPDEPMRSVNIDVSAYIYRPGDLENSRYFQMIASLVRESNALHMSLEDLTHCRIGEQMLTSKIMQEYVKNSDPILLFPKNSDPILRLPKNSELNLRLPKNSEPIRLLPKNSEPILRFPKNSEPIARLPKNSEPIPRFPKNSEPIPLFPKNSDPIPRFPKNSEPIPRFPRNSEPMARFPKNSEPIALLPRNSEPIIRFPKNSDPILLLPRNSEPIALFPRNSEPIALLPRNSEPILRFSSGSKNSSDPVLSKSALLSVRRERLPKNSDPKRRTGR